MIWAILYPLLAGITGFVGASLGTRRVCRRYFTAMAQFHNEAQDAARRADAASDLTRRLLQDNDPRESYRGDTGGWISGGSV